MCSTPTAHYALWGTDLSFDQNVTDEGCLIRGTRSGSAVQSRFVSISDTEITLLPDIPAQDDPWNNEYTLMVSTHYTETGILTDSSATPYAVIKGGSVSADETLRIQVILNIHENRLYCNLLDMREEGQEGDAVSVTANGDYTLPGFSGSAVSSLEISVNNYDALVDMIRNHYSGRLVDVLMVEVG